MKTATPPRSAYVCSAYAVEGEGMNKALEKFLGLADDPPKTIRDVLRRHILRTGGSLANLPDSSDTREMFNRKLCAICKKTCDIAVYFGKRTHPYCKACHAAYMRDWRSRNPLKPDQRRKDNCRSYAGQYLRRGKIKREPCKACGSSESQMHHPDYAKPLLVEWMCRPCHLREHYGPDEINRPQC